MVKVVRENARERPVVDNVSTLVVAVANNDLVVEHSEFDVAVDYVLIVAKYRLVLKSSWNTGCNSVWVLRHGVEI